MDDMFKPTKKKLIAAYVILACIVAALWLGDKIDIKMKKQVYQIMSTTTETGSVTNKIDDGAKVLESMISNFSEEQKVEIKTIYYQFFFIKWLAFTLLSYVFACFLFKRAGIEESP